MSVELRDKLQNNILTVVADKSDKELEEILFQLKSDAFEPIEIKNIRKTVIELVRLEPNAVKLKKTLRFILGIEGDSMEIQQLHQLTNDFHDYKKEQETKLKKMQAGIITLIGLVGLIASRMGLDIVEAVLKVIRGN
ncbi:MAG: hypothetical protein ACXAC7_04500 [Candidatus Hodarchaeales archaeon]